MSMFCYQCEQTAKGTACTINGACGKNAATANLQDQLTGKLIRLAQTAVRTGTDVETDRLLIDCLFSTVTNVNFNDENLQEWVQKVEEAINRREAKNEAGYALGSNYQLDQLWQSQETIRSLKTLILLGLRGMAAYTHHAMALGHHDPEIFSFFYKALADLGKALNTDELLALVMETGTTNLKAMELLDKANTGTYGHPVPTAVTTTIEKGPFIVVTGHDLRDLYLLLEQSQDQGVNIYTHSEMLPAHAYPELKKYPHLKGNYGTAWQNQQKEFAELPGAILFTTNCLTPPKDSYIDRVFTTGVVSFPQTTYIGEQKDFAPVIAKALALGGYQEDRRIPGMNGGELLTTGFAHQTVLGVADTIISGVKDGAIKHFFLVGGCDGAKPGRNYYTDFVKQTPKDTVILTLACGKYRFNDLDIGTIAGLPRILDMGQCNDAYSAVKVALALAEAFNCSVNELPLTLILSWYEQKAVAILLSLLALGIKNIYIGPSLPAFIASEVLDLLVKQYQLTPISTPEADLAKILG